MNSLYKYCCVTVFAIVVAIKCIAQPYIDLINVRYVNSPDCGVINQNNKPATLRYLNVSTTLPFQFKNKKDAIILSPYFESWSVKVKTVTNDFDEYYGIALPVTLLKTIPGTDWSFLATLIVRANANKFSEENMMQFGGAVLADFKANENLHYKLGIYANRELFGLFIMPLVGIDWQISNKTNLFGILPGHLTIEHKLGKRFYTGAAFRASTNSYAKEMGYWRMDENQLGIYADCYLSKHLVLNVEAGHSVMRKIRNGVKDEFKNDWKANDNVYFKIACAYRMRLR